MYAQFVIDFINAYELLNCIDATVYFRLTLALQNIDLKCPFRDRSKTQIKKQVANERKKERKKGRKKERKKERTEISYKICGYHDGHNEDCLLESDAV